MKAPLQSPDNMDSEREAFIAICDALLVRCKAAATDEELRALWIDLFELSNSAQRLAYQLQRIGRE